MAWNFDCCGAPLAHVLQAPQGLNPALPIRLPTISEILFGNSFVLIKINYSLQNIILPLEKSMKSHRYFVFNSIARIPFLTTTLDNTDPLFALVITPGFYLHHV